jgi:hypothetical protein
VYERRLRLREKEAATLRHSRHARNEAKALKRAAKQNRKEVERRDKDRGRGGGNAAGMDRALRAAGMSAGQLVPEAERHGLAGTAAETASAAGTASARRGVKEAGGGGGAPQAAGAPANHGHGWAATVLTELEALTPRAAAAAAAAAAAGAAAAGAARDAEYAASKAEAAADALRSRREEAQRQLDRRRKKKQEKKQADRGKRKARGGGGGGGGGTAGADAGASTAEGAVDGDGPYAVGEKGKGDGKGKAKAKPAGRRLRALRSAAAGGDGAVVLKSRSLLLGRQLHVMRGSTQTQTAQQGPELVVLGKPFTGGGGGGGEGGSGEAGTGGEEEDEEEEEEEGGGGGGGGRDSDRDGHDSSDGSSAERPPAVGNQRHDSTHAAFAVRAVVYRERGPLRVTLAAADPARMVGAKVRALKAGAARGLLQVGEVFVAANGRDVSLWAFDAICDHLQSLQEDAGQWPLTLTVLSRSTSTPSTPRQQQDQDQLVQDDRSRTCLVM